MSSELTRRRWIAWFIACVLGGASAAHAQPAADPSDDADAVTEVGPSPLYYRLPEIAPTFYYRGGPSFAIDLAHGATAFGFRLGLGAAFALARDPHHVIAVDAGYAYRGFDDHVGSIGLSYLFTDADVASDVTLRPGLAVSVAALGGGRASDLGAGMRVAIAFRCLYMFEVAYEWLSVRQGVLEHVLVLSMGGTGVVW